MKISSKIILFFLTFGSPVIAVNLQSLKIKFIEPTDSSFNLKDSNLVQMLVIEKDSLTSKIIERKIISAIFSFPFPFGFMGAHRVMLGTKPWVPIIYAATFGGCFGLLPLIDFCVIVLSKDIKQFENNPHVFMWIN